MHPREIIEGLLALAALVVFISWSEQTWRPRYDAWWERKFDKWENNSDRG